MKPRTRLCHAIDVLNDSDVGVLSTIWSDASRSYRGCGPSLTFQTGLGTKESGATRFIEDDPGDAEISNEPLGTICLQEDIKHHC